MIETRYLLGFPFATVDLKTHKIECMIDTGFDGALLLPFKVIHENELQRTGIVQCTRADGSIALTELFEAEIDWLENKKRIIVIGMETDFSLIGMQLLAEAKTTLEPAKKVLTIEPT